MLARHVDGMTPPPRCHPGKASDGCKIGGAPPVFLAAAGPQLRGSEALPPIPGVDKTEGE
jgi:hypothetical protein